MMTNHYVLNDSDVPRTMRRIKFLSSEPAIKSSIYLQASLLGLIMYICSSLLPMGATASTPATNDTLSSLDTASPNYIFKLYSREFERDEEPLQEDNLYLDGYGDDDSGDMPATESSPVETPSPSVEEDDYPIEKMSANFETVPPILPAVPRTLTIDETEPAVDIHASFEEARASRHSELDTKYPSLSSRGSVCESERSVLMQCYKDNADVLSCRDAVSSYARCAQSATSELLRK